LNNSRDSIGTRSDSDEDVHARLVAIAKHKREVLERVFEPWTGGSVDKPPSEPGTIDGGTAKKADPACSYLRNKSEIFNIFDPCFATMEFIPQELAGRTTDFPRIITHHVDKRIEKELSVQKFRPTCIVCTIQLKGTNFICPTCETKYCIRCARALAKRKESCWTCRRPLRQDML
jgi:hypothetical protein